MVRINAKLANRELSWLEFNSRVLQLAENPELPLIERVRFLSIFHSNLDEFFMVRVATLLRRIDLGYEYDQDADLSNSQLLSKISHEVNEFSRRIEELYFADLLPNLKKHGISLTHYQQLSKTERVELDRFFDEKIFPVLTPLTVDPSHPFPHISGLSLNFGIYVKYKGEQKQFVRLKIPPNFARLFPFQNPEGLVYIWLEEIIGANLSKLFPGATVEEFFLFRVTRNQDLEIDDEENEDLLALMQEELEKRRFGDVVRLEVENVYDEKLLLNLIEEFELNNIQIYKSGTPLALVSLAEVCSIDLPMLKFSPLQSVTHPQLIGLDDDDPESFFTRLRNGEILLHHPYQSFSTSVARFVELAARDPKVLAIKQTLYRTSGDSPIMLALIEAAKAGKQVLAVIEIRARFDETANVRWAQILEDAGVHVVYGILGLKTHAKASLVIREENGHLRRYSHIGTGNYNPRTARMYEDLGLLSADELLGRDLTTLFNQLSGFAPEAEYSRLLIAPKYLREGILLRINREVENHLAGKTSRIRMKLNSIVDPEVINALYRAANVGVPVEMSIRGICCIDSRSVEIAARLKVKSYLGRFLEHSRIYNFYNDGNEEFWIGSADMMDRNLNRRIESLVNIQDPQHKLYLENMLNEMFSENYKSWSLDSNNHWQFDSATENGEIRHDFQEFYIKEVCR
ncbi:MAG: polyphosphate kinase 1 [Candidatus Nanopelagicaceae bacterium]